MTRQDDIETGSGPISRVRGSNQSGMRAHNERLVLSLIRQRGALAKAEISRLTGLSAQTVSVIMRGLEAEGLLKKGEPVRGKIGQPSIPMDLNPTGAYFLGLKIGRRSLDLILTDFLGRVEGRVHLTHKYPTPDGVVRFANDSIDQLLNQLAPEQRERVSGLGIALPFRLWDWAKPLGVKSEEMEDWLSRNVAEEIAARWDFPVYICNDASAACGAELVFGDQNRPSDFLYLFIGFFVGGGLVLDNTLITGKSGNAAALGSMPLGMKGNKPRQLIDTASLASLERALVAEGGNGDMIWQSSQDWQLPEHLVSNWMEEACDSIAYAIMSAACLLDFECVMIDGWLPLAVRSEMVEKVRARIEAIEMAGVEKPEIREGSIGSGARSLGAASLPLSERFLIDRDSFLKG